MTGRTKVISIDCMGGDDAPEVIINGLSQAIHFDNSFHYKLFGDGPKITALLKKYSVQMDVIEVIHTSGFDVHAEMKPSFAIKNAMRSSMGMAINSVKNGDADACISAGNTGAYMGLSKVILKMLDGVERPAIASVIPTQKAGVIMLDLGANAECSANNLVEFALMGEALSRAAFGKSSPSVAILNIGTEDNKGNSLVKCAAKELSERGILDNFVGFIEGDKIFYGDVDVVVSDGFCGNVMLKVMEGIARFILDEVRSAFHGGVFSFIAGLFARPFLKGHLMRKLDPRLYNGAILMGVNGVAVKSHGGSDAFGFANAVRFTIRIVNSDLVKNASELVIKSAISVEESANS